MIALPQERINLKYAPLDIQTREIANDYAKQHLEQTRYDQARKDKLDKEYVDFANVKPEQLIGARLQQGQMGEMENLIHSWAKMHQSDPDGKNSVNNFMTMKLQRAAFENKQEKWVQAAQEYSKSKLEKDKNPDKYDLDNFNKKEEALVNGDFNGVAPTEFLKIKPKDFIETSSEWLGSITKGKKFEEIPLNDSKGQPVIKSDIAGRYYQTKKYPDQILDEVTHKALLDDGSSTDLINSLKPYMASKEDGDRIIPGTDLSWNEAQRQATLINDPQKPASYLIARQKIENAFDAPGMKRLAREPKVSDKDKTIYSPNQPTIIRNSKGESFNVQEGFQPPNNAINSTTIENDTYSITDGTPKQMQGKVAHGIRVFPKYGVIMGKVDASEPKKIGDRYNLSAGKNLVKGQPQKGMVFYDTKTKQELNEDQVNSKLNQNEDYIHNIVVANKKSHSNPVQLDYASSQKKEELVLNPMNEAQSEKYGYEGELREAREMPELAKKLFSKAEGKVENQTSKLPDEIYKNAKKQMQHPEKLDKNKLDLYSKQVKDYESTVSDYKGKTLVYKGHEYTFDELMSFKGATADGLKNKIKNKEIIVK